LLATARFLKATQARLVDIFEHAIILKLRQIKLDNCFSGGRAFLYPNHGFFWMNFI